MKLSYASCIEACYLSTLLHPQSVVSESTSTKHNIYTQSIKVSH